MKSPSRKKAAKDFATSVGRALRRAAKIAQTIARMAWAVIYRTFNPVNPCSSVFIRG
jgi:hypothetical protein